MLPGETRFTCTACAATLLLEFGTLSRLTGNQMYEQKAKHAMKCVFGKAKCCVVVLLVGNLHQWTSVLPAVMYVEQIHKATTYLALPHCPLSYPGQPGMILGFSLN